MPTPVRKKTAQQRAVESCRPITGFIQIKRTRDVIEKEKVEQTTAATGTASSSSGLSGPDDVVVVAAGDDDADLGTSRKLSTEEHTRKSDDGVDADFERLRHRAEDGTITATERVLLYDYQRYLYNHKNGIVGPSGSTGSSNNHSVGGLKKKPTGRPYRYSYWKTFVWEVENPL
eukprot:PhM_4_TR6192/c0_g1_i3/m.43382